MLQRLGQICNALANDTVNPLASSRILTERCVRGHTSLGLCAT